jgi:hypothetical protein
MPRAGRKRRREVPDASGPDPFLDALVDCKELETTDFAHAWVGMEPTFSNRKAVRKWLSLTRKKGGEDAFFEDKYMIGKARRVARAIERKYRARRKEGDPACLFESVERERERDPWKVERQNLRFPLGRRGAFEVRLGLDPETFEYSIKPVPVAWFYDARFVRFLQEFVWDVPQELGLVASIAHGGGQFSISAKTFLSGSLLADDIASRLDHPELATWILDFPNADDRSFRATRRRARAFRELLDAYWRGGFHPRAIGTLLVENAYLDRGFGPAPEPPANLMDDRTGPVGDPREVFQTNFAFGRAVRLHAQGVDPGYWQSAHPDDDGFRPDQVMRYSEGNLNRLQIAGEWHVKSGKVLDEDDVRDLDEPLEIRSLYDEASWEIRGQMSRTSAADFVEALLLEIHHAKYLAAHPHVRVRGSLLQDQLLGDAEETLRRRAPNVLARLSREAFEENLSLSRGRMKTDRIEPETLFWAAWKHLPGGERAAIAREAVSGFLGRVHAAASEDRRPDAPPDPMEPHRHRIHPLLWDALEEEPQALDADAEVKREWSAWNLDRKRYLARRPIWSPLGSKPPWA